MRYFSRRSTVERVASRRIVARAYGTPRIGKIPRSSSRICTLMSATTSRSGGSSSQATSSCVEGSRRSPTSTTTRRWRRSGAPRPGAARRWRSTLTRSERSGCSTPFPDGLLVMRNGHRGAARSRGIARAVGGDGANAVDAAITQTTAFCAHRYVVRRHTGLLHKPVRRGVAVAETVHRLVAGDGEGHRGSGIACVAGAGAARDDVHGVVRRPEPGGRNDHGERRGGGVSNRHDDDIVVRAAVVIGGAQNDRVRAVRE